MKIGDKVKVLVGRNKDEIGTISLVRADNVCVDFNRKLLVNEGFGSMANYEDFYWVKTEFAEKV